VSREKKHKTPIIRIVDNDIKDALEVGDDKCVIDQFPFAVRMKIAKMYMAKKSYREIEADLAEEGYKVGHMTIYRWCLRWLHTFDTSARIHEDKIAQLQDEVIAKGLEQGLKAIQTCSLPEIKTPKEFEQVVGAISKLITARAQVERVKVETTRAVEALREDFKRRLQQELGAYPDVVEQIHVILENATEDIKAANIPRLEA
jgi:uncharacterized protein YerC